MKKQSAQKALRAPAAACLVVAIFAAFSMPLAAQDHPSSDRPPKLDCTTHKLSAR